MDTYGKSEDNRISGAQTETNRLLDEASKLLRILEKRLDAVESLRASAETLRTRSLALVLAGLLVAAAAGIALYSSSKGTPPNEEKEQTAKETKEEKKETEERITEQGTAGGGSGTNGSQNGRGETASQSPLAPQAKPETEAAGAPRAKNKGETGPVPDENAGTGKANAETLLPSEEKIDAGEQTDVRDGASGVDVGGLNAADGTPLQTSGDHLDEMLDFEGVAFSCFRKRVVSEVSEEARKATKNRTPMCTKYANWLIGSNDDNLQIYKKACCALDSVIWLGKSRAPVICAGIPDLDTCTASDGRPIQSIRNEYDQDVLCSDLPREICKNRSDDYTAGDALSVISDSLGDQKLKSTWRDINSVMIAVGTDRGEATRTEAIKLLWILLLEINSPDFERDRQNCFGQSADGH